MFGWAQLNIVRYYLDVWIVIKYPSKLSAAGELLKIDESVK